jgi:DNA-binding transcriptional MocR family regulator
MERAQAKEMSTIVLGYAGLTEEEIRKGVDLLRKALE